MIDRPGNYKIERVPNTLLVKVTLTPEFMEHNRDFYTMGCPTNDDVSKNSEYLRQVLNLDITPQVNVFDDKEFYQPKLTFREAEQFASAKNDPSISLPTLEEVLAIMPLTNKKNRSLPITNIELAVGFWTQSYSNDGKILYVDFGFNADTFGTPPYIGKENPNSEKRLSALLVKR